MEDAVGPVLRMCSELELVLKALAEDNPEQELDVLDQGAYVRVHGHARLRLRLATLQQYLGATFQMRQLESMLVAFAGRIATSSDEVNWSLEQSQPKPRVLS